MDWKPIILQYSLRITGNRWDAEDLAQESMIKLLEAVRSHPERPITRSFLYRIAKNTWIDVQRKQKLKTVPFEREYEAGAPDPLLSTRELLEQLVERLAPKMAVILLLMDVFDFTAKETAVIVRMKEAAVQVALGRARHRLRLLAQEPAKQRTINPSKPTPFNFDAMVEAFHRRDPYAIYQAYIGLTHGGVRLTELREWNGRMHFTFKDPDGNLFRIASK